MIATDTPEKLKLKEKEQRKKQMKPAKKIEFVKDSSRTFKIKKNTKKVEGEDQSSDEELHQLETLLADELNNQSSDISEEEFGDKKIGFVDKDPTFCFSVLVILLHELQLFLI